LFIVLACVMLAGLATNIGPMVNAQSSHGTFIDLLKPYLNKQVRIAGPPGRSFSPSFLKEVGVDYILLDTPGGLTQAIPLYSIYSVTLVETPEIHLSGY
jgi:hypothetical protein